MKIVKLEHVACDGCGYETICVFGLKEIGK